MRGGAAAPADNGEGGCARMATCLGGIPLATRLVVGACLVIYAYYPLLYSDDDAFGYSAPLYPPAVFAPFWEVHRLLSHAFVHGGFFHVAMNMSAAFYIMTDLERRFGTLCTLGQVLLFAVLDALLYCGGYFATVGSRVNGYFGPVVGFSGVLFSQLVVETAVLPPGTRRSLFGFCQVPAWIYPWVLLGVLALVPGVSFTGHLCGILVGYLYAKGALNMLSLPRKWLLAFERWERVSCIVDAGFYSRCPLEPQLPDPFARSAALAAISTACANACDSCLGGVRTSAASLQERVADRRLRQADYYEAVDVAAAGEGDLELGLMDEAGAARSDAPVVARGGCCGAQPSAAPASCCGSAGELGAAAGDAGGSCCATGEPHGELPGVPLAAGGGGAAPVPRTQRAQAPPGAQAKRHHQSRLVQQAAARSPRGAPGS